MESTFAIGGRHQARLPVVRRRHNTAAIVMLHCSKLAYKCCSAANNRLSGSQGPLPSPAYQALPETASNP